MRVAKQIGLLITMLWALASWGDGHESVVTQVLDNQLLVSVSQEKPTPWQLDDQVCFIRNQEKVACGLVVYAKEKVARVKVLDQKRAIRLADHVVSSQPDRLLASLTNGLDERAYKNPQDLRYDMTSGLTTNLSSFIYFLHFQGFINGNVTLGFQPSLLRATDASNSLNAFGALFTVNYYGSGLYRGFWVYGASGLFAIPSSTGSFRETIYSPALIGGVGWRANWALGFNIGMSVGGQYIAQSQNVAADVQFSSLSPYFLIDIGFNF